MSFEWQAGSWLRWARTPGHDSYWHFREAFFDAIVPAPGRLTLEVGCGEGRVARDLSRHGHRVVALDASPTLAVSAAAADPDGRYLAAAAAAALPFGDECIAAPASALTTRAGYERWQRLPNFLHLRAVKPA